MSTMQTRLAVAAVATAARITQTLAWGGGNSRTYSTGLYYPNESYDWMYSANNIAMKVEGCVWSTTDDNEDMGCMEDDSGDGTTYWYQMAMCRRAQVAYSVYATDSGSANCNGGNFKGSVSPRGIGRGLCTRSVRPIRSLR